MALDDVRHVEAVALIKALVEESAERAGGMLMSGPVALRWCAENHPPPSAYMAAMTNLREGKVMEPCTCGHAPEEHAQSIGLGACEADGCECIQYEADLEDDGE